MNIKCWLHYISAILLLPSVFLSLSLAAAADQHERTRPNIVFFLVDDLGWTDVGCYGSDYHQTPNIDRLAAEGIRFTGAYAACNACSPTRAAILTGLHPARLRLTDWIPGQRTQPSHKFKPPAWTQRLEHRHVTLAEALQADGYRTLRVGKWLGVPHSSVRSGRYKLIEFFEGNRFELYDLHSDLGEQKNLAADLPAKTRALLNKLHAWREQINAQLPIPIQ